MAYLSFDGFGSAVPLGGTATGLASAAIPADEGSLSPLEWSVVAVARTDRPSSLRRPGPIGRALRGLFGLANPMLADPRLEALRRIAVLTWRLGYAVPPHELRAFLAAGFTERQYEKMADGIGILRYRAANPAFA